MNRIPLVIAAVAAVLLPDVAIAHGANAAVVVYGAAKPQQRELVSTSVQQVLRSASWTVQDRPLSAREHETVIACLSLDRPWPCVAATARDQGVDHVVVIHIEADTADKGLVLTGQILVAGDAVPSTDRGWCPKCSDATLATSASELAALMLKHSTARQAVEKPAAKSSGNPVGPAPRPVAVATPDPATSVAPQSAPSAPRWVPAVVVGAGVVALGVGGYLSYRASAPADGRQSQYVFSGPGIGLAAAGGVAIGVGVYLWLRQSGHRSERASAPTISPASGGAVAGWVAEF